MSGLRLSRVLQRVSKEATHRASPPISVSTQAHNPENVLYLSSRITPCTRSISSSQKTPSPSQATPPIPSPHIPLPDDAQTLLLPDGRHLGYCQYGPLTGNPILFIHGTPDCRIDLTSTPRDIALMHKLHIRWIGIDRPGIGLSSPNPGRTVRDWIPDVQQLIRELELETLGYRILGVSGGTPHALACAKFLPREQVHGVGIMAGVGPWHAGLAGTNLLNRYGIRMWKYLPGLVTWVHNRNIVPLMLDPDPNKAVETFRKQVKYFPAKDRGILGSEEGIRVIATIMREVYRGGDASGVREEMRLALGDWGFDVEDVGFRGVRLWYGKEDVNTPPEAGRWMAERLPGSVLKEYEGKSHFSIWDHAEEILTDLLQDK